MGKYRIITSFCTGDSFGSNDTTDTLELSWDNLDIAKENLAAIKEHYKMYDELERARNREQPILEKYRNNWWFVEETRPISIRTNCAETEEQYENNPELYKREIGVTMAQNCMKLKTDIGTTMQQWNPWCGYFEHLYSAEIIMDEELNDLKFTV